MVSPWDETKNTSIHDDASTSVSPLPVTTTVDGAKRRLDVNTTVSAASPNTGKYISVYLRDGTARNMDVDGSGTPVVYSAGPPTGKRWYIHRMMIVMRDGGITWANFGGIAALTNGLALDYDSGGVNFDLLDTETIKRNLEFVNYGYDAEINTASQDIFRFRWTFAESGTVLDLNNTDGDNFNATVSDNLTALTRFRTVIQGYEVDE